MKKIILILVMIIPFILSAVTVTVKSDGTGDYEEIGDAFLDSGIQQNGGIIYVFPGTYYAAYLYFGTTQHVDIEIIGTNQSTCIVEGSGSNYTFYVSNPQSTLTIKNLTLTDGNLAGVYIEEESYGETIIEQCLITGNCVEVIPIYHKSPIICHGNAIIKNNNITDNENTWFSNLYDDYSIGGAFYIDYVDTSLNDGYIEIIDNTITENYAYDCGVLYATTNQSIIMNGNYIEDNGLQPSDYEPANNYPGWINIAKFDNCSRVEMKNNVFWENAAYTYPYFPNYDREGIYFEDCDDVFVTNNTISENILSSATFGVTAISIDSAGYGDYEFINNAIYNNWKGFVQYSSAPTSLTIDYNCVYHNPPNSGNTNYNGCSAGSHDFSSDPQISSSTFQPIWNSSTISPCIDSGDPNITDDDDTPSDIGAICAAEHKIDEIDLPSPLHDSGWKWLSFPSLDVVYDDADIAENVLADILNPNILDYVLNQDYTIDWNGEEWDNIDEEFARTEGFKFKMLAADELEVIGFKVADNTPVSLTGEDEDNWIGYWLEDTQSVSDAFSDYWDGENIHYIQHQYWTATYYMDTWWYQCQAGHSPTISYGEMVNIHCNDNMSTFRWDNSTPEEQRMMIPETEYYTIEEQANYTPIYVSLEETNLPQEIGAFVNGECVGASIVTEQLCQLNAYTESTSPGNIELELYYGSRSSNSPVRLSNYSCQNTLEPNCIQRQINTKVNPEAWFVTLGDNSQTVNSIKKLTLDNYPNPFNPTTTISYNIPHEGKVFLEIYNIKGQLVKQLVSGNQPEGYYEVNWNGRDGNDKSVSSGLYFYKLRTEDKIISKKMLLLK